MKKKINDIFVFPNMGDGGLCVGASALCENQKKNLEVKTKLILFRLWLFK